MSMLAIFFTAVSAALFIISLHLFIDHDELGLSLVLFMGAGFVVLWALAILSFQSNGDD